MLMHNPPHPGEVIKDLCLEPLGLTITEAAEGLGVSRKQLSMLVNGRAGISPDMAIRLAQAFGGRVNHSAPPFRGHALKCDNVSYEKYVAIDQH